MITQLKQLIEDNPDFFDIGNPAGIDRIIEAENFLGVKFPSSFIEYLRNWGTLACGPLEFYGITDGDFAENCIPNAIWYTQVKRAEVNLPFNLVVIFNNDGDEYYCVDTESSEGAILVWEMVSRNVTIKKAENISELIYNESLDYI